MKMFIVSSIVYFLAVIPCSAFEASVFPQNPKGGEGFLLVINGEPNECFEITFNEKHYVPYNFEGGKKEIFLPIKIEEKGRKKIIVQRKLQNEQFETKELEIEIREREITTVYLNESSEKMRKQQPMIEKQNELILNALRNRGNDMLWENEFILPLDNSVSTYFGLKRKGKTYSYYHRGLDFSASKGTPVKAVNNGKVVLGEEKLNVYGNSLVIDHGQGITSCYFHLNKILKKTSDIVKKGEIIAEVGSTGWSTGPHLHMGIYLQGEAVDPLWWIDFTNSLLPN